MCGIAGVFLKQGDTASESLTSMLNAIRHRGFSGHETGKGQHWAIGANRLEIVDRLNGRQPFYSNDGTIAVVFNGEIYNYKTLRAELETEGYRFRTDTDTEVIAHGFHHWRENLFDRLDGMFAVIAYDSTDNRYFAARDPVGVKPLYISAKPTGAFIASEIKALLQVGGDIQEIPPGSFICTGGHVSYFATWPDMHIGSSLASNGALLRELFSGAVRKRVDTDLPVAVFLSAGIDSAAVIYEAAHHHADVLGVSIGTEDAPDVVCAKRLCRDLNFRLKHISVSEQALLAAIPEVIWTIESFEPNHIRGGCLSYVMSGEVARAGYRIALCGEGADELFGGYREFGLSLIQGKSAKTVEKMIDRFVSELYVTQLKRVDRTSMRFALEVREPFLDKSIVSLARRLPLDQKVALLDGGRVADKRVLREAYRGVLPDWVVDRTKTVLSLGAGFGSNGPEGIFYANGLEWVTEAEFRVMRTEFPEYNLQNREEAYYFKIFRRLFGDLALAKRRPMVNATPVGV